MSDKAKHLISKYLNEKMGISFGSLTVYDHTTVKKLVDFSIEHHFEDVLGKAELKWNSFQKQAYDNIQYQQHNSKNGPSYFYQNGWNDALNLLKQRRG